MASSYFQLTLAFSKNGLAQGALNALAGGFLEILFRQAHDLCEGQQVGNDDDLIYSLRKDGIPAELNRQEAFDVAANFKSSFELEFLTWLGARDDGDSYGAVSMFSLESNSDSEECRVDLLINSKVYHLVTYLSDMKVRGHLKNDLKAECVMFDRRDLKWKSIFSDMEKDGIARFSDFKLS